MSFDSMSGSAMALSADEDSRFHLAPAGEDASDDFEELPADLESGGVTTVMIKNISCRSGVADVEALLRKVGLQGCYESVHIPTRRAAATKRRTTNFGYAFVKFLDPSYIPQCYDRLNGRQLKAGVNNRAVEVVPARQQVRPEKSRSNSGPGTSSLMCNGDSIDDATTSTAASESHGAASFLRGSDSLTLDRAAPPPGLTIFSESWSLPSELDFGMEQTRSATPKRTPFLPTKVLVDRMPTYFSVVHITMLLEEAGCAGLYECIEMDHGLGAVTCKSGPAGETIAATLSDRWVASMPGAPLTHRLQARPATAEVSSPSSSWLMKSL